ncbi:hypothetical protein ACHAXH_006069 [Discostella pseudostelligera]
MGFFGGRTSGRNPQSGCANSVSSSSAGGQSESHQSLESLDLQQHQQAVPTVNLAERRLQEWKNAGNGTTRTATIPSPSGGPPPPSPPPPRRRGVGFSPSTAVKQQQHNQPPAQAAAPSQQHASSSPNNLILLIERGQWAAASERAKSHPQEVKQLAKLRKTTAGNSIPPTMGSSNDGKKDLRISNVKCKALHHACQKLRSVHTTFYQHPNISSSNTNNIEGGRALLIEEDEYIEACKCLLTLIQVHPEACRERESRHGCLPLHLCVFSMCDTPPPPLPPPSAAARGSTRLSGSSTGTGAAAGGSDCAGVGDMFYDGLKMIFGTSATGVTSSQQQKQQQQPISSLSPPLPLSPSARSFSNQQHRTILSSGSGDFSLGNMSQMFQEESEHQRALSDHQQNSRSGSRDRINQDGGLDDADDDGGIGDTTFEMIQKGMDDMEKLLIGLENKYEKKLEEKRKGKGGMMNRMKQKLSNKNNRGDDPPGQNATGQDMGGVSASTTSAAAAAVTSMPSTTSTSKTTTTTTILNSMTPMDCVDERSRETDSHSTPQHNSNGSGNSEEFMPRSSSFYRSGGTQQPSKTATAATSPSSTTPPTYEDLQRRYLQINTQRREEYSVRVINALLDAWPKSIKTASEGGRLPLHMACFGKASVKVLETVLKAYPDAARQRNHDGFLPVHIAAHWGVSHPDVAPLLLTAYPDGAVGRNRWERTPIEEALGMAGENGRQHQLSLVWSLRRHPTYWIHNDIASMLLPRNVRMAPWRLVEMEDDDDDGGEDGIGGGELGASTMANEKNISKIPLGKLGRVISSGSTATGAVDVDEVGSSDEEVEGVEVHLRRSSSKANSNNKGPSPSALARTTELSLLITKEKHWAAATLRCTSHPHEAREAMEVKVRGAYTAKITPLHYACEHKPSVEVIKTLIAANPTALERRQEPGGQLPLHAACTWGASPDVVRVLLSALPSCAEMKDFLSNLPLHCACYSGADSEVVESLLQVYPQSVLPRNHQGSSAADIVRRLCHPNRKEVLHLLEKTMSGLLERVVPGKEENLEVDQNNNLEWV